MDVVLKAWFDGACEPVNPGGIGTWGFVVDEAGHEVASGCGLVPPASPERMTNNIAEYAALLHVLEWLLAHRPGEAVQVHGDSRLVVHQVNGTWKANVPALVRLRDAARERMQRHGAVTLLHVPRLENPRADALTHKAYVEALDGDSVLRARYMHAFATPAQVEACKRAGIPVYKYMGKTEASRLLANAHEAQV